MHQVLMDQERKNIVQKNKVLKAAKQDAAGSNRRRQIGSLLYGTGGGPTITIAGDKPKTPQSRSASRSSKFIHRRAGGRTPVNQFSAFAFSPKDGQVKGLIDSTFTDFQDGGTTNTHQEILTN